MSSRNFFYIFSFIFINASAIAQPWMENVGKKDNQNFYEIKNNFDTYWKDRVPIKGSGYIQFQRWENFMEPRLYPNGDFSVINESFHTWQKYRALQESAIFKKEENKSNWQPLGPTSPPANKSQQIFTGGLGRVNCMAFHPHSSDTIWLGTPSGGLWKTTNGGLHWTVNAAFDKLPTIGISDIVINPIHPDTMYLLTGDADFPHSFSVGVLRSKDGGQTWDTTGLNWDISGRQIISRLIMHPTNPNILFATSGAKGVWKTMDAGVTWKLVLPLAMGFKDIEFQPANPSIIYVSGKSVYKSTDSGSTWKDLDPGQLPSGGGAYFKISTTVSNPKVVYALHSNPLALLKSSDEGITWTSIPVNSAIYGSPNLLFYAWAFSISPTDENVLFVGNLEMWKSIDGGTSWTQSNSWFGSGVPYVHADIHNIKFAPNNGNVVYSLCDGGIFKSTDKGLNWSDISKDLQISQFYRLGSSATDVNIIYAGAQDNGTNRYNAGSWSFVDGGDGMECIVDPTDADIVYSSLQWGNLQRSIDGGKSFKAIGPTETGVKGSWFTPFVLSYNKHNFIYGAYNWGIYKSIDAGFSWSRLTGSPSSANTLAVSADDKYIYASSMGSKYYDLYQYDGYLWNIVSKELPSDTIAISGIAIHPYDSKTIWVTFGGYVNGKKIYKSTDAGKTWINVSGNLPNIPVNCIVYEKDSPNSLYIGTDWGVFYRDDELDNWEAYNKGLPNVITTDLEIQYTAKKLRAATFGRGLWETDVYGKSSANILTSELDKDIIVYPNPSINGNFKIHVGSYLLKQKATLNIYNLLGEKIKQLNYMLLPQDINLELPTEAEGIYFLELITEQGRYNKKIF